MKPFNATGIKGISQTELFNPAAIQATDVSGANLVIQFGLATKLIGFATAADAEKARTQFNALWTAAMLATS